MSNLATLLEQHQHEIAQYKVLQAQIKELEKQLKPIKEKLLSVPEFVKITTRSTADVKELKEVFPEVYDLVMKTSEVRTLIV